MPPPPPPPPPPQQQQRQKPHIGHVSLPYYAGVSEDIARLLKSKGISSSFNCRGSMRETLVKPKDQLEKEQDVGVLYWLGCAGHNSIPCPGTYVGETERTAAARFQEHTSTATNALGKYKSAMLQHAREHGHHFCKEDMTILASEQDWAKRGIYEAAFIRILEPSINIDPGRHTLSSHFDSILKKVIKAPAAPAPHNPDTEELINTAPRGQGRPRKQPTNSNSQPNPQSEQFQRPDLQLQHQSQPPPQPQRQSQRIRDRRNRESSSQPD